MDIQAIRNKLTSLKGEQRQGAIAAVKAILNSRSSPSNNQQPQTGKDLKIDPNLLIPTSGNKQSKYNENDFDDPDNLLKKRKFHTDPNNNKNTGSENKPQQASDENEETSEKQNSSENKNQSRKPNPQSDSSKETSRPQIGDQGDPESDLRRAEDAYRKANEYKEEAEEKAEQAKADGDSAEAKKQRELADKASALADKASDLADGDDLDSKEQARLKRIQDALHDINIERKIQNETENAVLTDREAQRRKEQQRKAKEFNTRPGGLAAFKRSIDKFMKDQLAAKREASWKRPNKRYPAETGIVLRGKARVEKRNVPLLVVYFDQSGSWDDSDVEKGLKAIESLNYYVKQHKLKLEVYYFSANIHDNPESAREEGTTLGADELIEDIKRKRPNNVVIMTDSDPDHCDECPSVMVDGGVWLLFRDGSISKQLYQNVRGKMLTEVFEI